MPGAGCAAPVATSRAHQLGGSRPAPLSRGASVHACKARYEVSTSSPQGCAWSPVASREVGLAGDRGHLLTPNPVEQSDGGRSVAGAPLMGCEKQRESDVLIRVAGAVGIQ